MPERLSAIVEPAELEYLSLEQAAALCSVSEERFRKWVEIGPLPLIETGGQRLVRAQDLIRHLIEHNIRLPERLLPGQARKILFIMRKSEMPPGMEIAWALYHLQRSSPSVFNFIEDDENADLKIITFDPDYIFLFPPANEKSADIARFNAMLNRPIPVRIFSPDSVGDLDGITN
ncbi:MAG: helix-turn-helix domain-containing protein [Desulfobulbaceae bacterium]|jgi:excisionase family DNA binding protein|nr:helix-turn-helix domain-containing protein [Desulfobulbaceae bacterium]